MSRIFPEYVIGKSCSSLFREDGFRDVAGIHNYLITPKKREDDYIDKYEVINDILDCYSDLRAIADEENQKKDFVDVINSSKSIPLSFDQINEYFQAEDRGDEPPIRLITKISHELFHNIYALVHDPNKVLRRDRAKVPVGRVQQQDTQCIRWLIKQPGRTTIERAGNQQKILAVIRYESIDTLENRVLKHFLSLCLSECSTYLRQFSAERYKTSSKIKEVTRLRNLAQYALSQPEFKTITDIYTLPKPNFVLRKNPLYCSIWDYYLKLLSKTRIVETVWANRHMLIHDFVKLLYFCNMHKTMRTDKLIKHNVWINPYPDNEGRMYSMPSYYYDFSSSSLSSDSKVSIKIEEAETSLICSTYEERYRMESKEKFKIAFIPDGFEKPDFNIRTDYMAIVYLENRKIPFSKISRNIKLVVPSSNTIEYLYDAVRNVCHG